MNVFAKFDEIPSKTLQDIKETKRHGHTFVRLFVRTDNVKTVYPPTNTVYGGYNNPCVGLGKAVARLFKYTNLPKHSLVAYTIPLSLIYIYLLY